MKRPIHVLIVEDKEAARESLQLALEDFECEFDEAENAATALQLIREHDYDVIFLDLKLPDGSGIDLLAEAKAVRPDLGKVIVVTAVAEEQTKSESKRLGVFAYLIKLDYDEVRTKFSEATSTIPRSRLPVSTHTAQPIQQSNVPRDVKAVMRDPLRQLLVLDDEKAWLDAIKDVLQNDFDPITTCDPDEACRLAAKGSFALAIVDMKLGETTGLDVLKKLRDVAPGLPAIILTAYPDFATAFETGKSPALAYVEKRELAMLAGKVKELLSTKTQPVRIFLSYAVDDHEHVVELFDNLTRHGFLPFMAAKTLVPGQAWKLEIERAIEDADYFIFCHSYHSVRREGTLLREMRQALERLKGMNDDRIFFITARLDQCEVGPPLNERQWVDLFEPEGFTNLLRGFLRN